jgi:long-chain acyl-CoA synthetase
MVAESDAISDRLRRFARERPGSVALVCDDRAQDFAMFDRHSSQVANALIAAGVRPQQRFGYLCKNTDYVYELLFGAAKSRSVAVGLNWRLAPAELAYILEDAETHLVFADAEMAPLLEQALSGCSISVTVINLDLEQGQQFDYRTWRDAADPTDPNLPKAAEDVVFQLYTSGTTGRPKGVQITHANIAAQRAAEALSGDWARWRNDDVGLVVMPLYHVGGLMMGVISLCAGALTVVSKHTDPASLVRQIDMHNVTMTFLVPVLIQSLLPCSHAPSPSCDAAWCRSMA